jgi:RHS repeat-associated protein
VTTYRYDERDRLIEQNIGGEITRYEFDPVGLLTKLTLPDSSYISYAYDAAHRLTSVSDTEGNSINYQLDEAGNVLKETVTDDAGSLVRTAQHAYDDLNRVTQNINAGGDAAQYSYDANGNVIGATDEVGLTSQYDFDAFNRLIQAVNPATYQTHFEYNRYDEVTEATDPRNLKTTYSYDVLGNRLAVNSPDSGQTSYEYDAAGNVVAVTNAKEETRQMTYDALNRLVFVQYVRGKTTTYGYDEGANGIGLMTSLRMSNNSSSTDFDYDQHGRLIQKELVIGPKSLITGYSYNDVGQLVGITYPSGASVSYQYNSQTGKLSGIKVNGQSLVSNMAYEPFGSIKGWSAGNGSAMLRTFNTDGFLTKQEQSGDSLEWSYDAAGKLVGVNDNEQQGAFSYYDDGALLSREFGTLYDIYTLDENHNRSYDGGLGNYSLYEIADDNNQILSTTPVFDYVIDNDAASALTYSATGNLIQNANFIMGYNETERMYIAADRHSHDFTLYFYNGLGERTYKIGASGSGRVLYAYDQDQRIIGEYQQARNSTDILASTETIYMPDVAGYGARDGYMPIGVLKDGQLYFVSSGQLGEPRQITDQSGQLVWSWQHDAFGKGEPDQRPAGASKDFVYNNRFPGQTYDAETGFFYNLNRYYDPNTGRYTRPDPIGLAGGMNPYVYVGGDPVNSVDPEGLYLNKEGLYLNKIVSQLSKYGTGKALEPWVVQHIDDPVKQRLALAMSKGLVGGAVNGMLVGGAAGGIAVGGIGTVPGAFVGGVTGAFSGILIELTKQTAMEVFDVPEKMDVLEDVLNNEQEELCH